MGSRWSSDTTQMVSNVYAHLWPDDDDRTRDAVEDVLGQYVNTSARVARGAHESSVET